MQHAESSGAQRFRGIDKREDATGVLQDEAAVGETEEGVVRAVRGGDFNLHVALELAGRVGLEIEGEPAVLREFIGCSETNRRVKRMLLEACADKGNLGPRRRDNSRHCENAGIRTLRTLRSE